MKFKFDNVYGCRSGARVFAAECDRICALQACTEGTQNNASDENIVHTYNQIDRADLEGLEGLEIGDIMTPINCFVLSVRPHAIVLCDSHLFHLFHRWRGRAQTQAYQPKSYELQDYLFMHFVEENYTICNDGMNEVNEKLFYMTVYVRTISGKTISIKCDKRQGITRVKDEIERRTNIPKALQPLVNQGKTLGERKTIEESNIKDETTLEMTLRLQGGMKEDEMMTSAGSAEDKNLRRKQSELGEIQLSDDTEHIKREINNASRRPEEKWNVSQEHQKKKWNVYCRNYM